MNKLKKMKENIKGFTLVEIIVVLLILAILAAIAIPSMLGYVNEARNSEYIAEAHVGYVAAQTVATKEAASADTNKASDAEITKYLVTAPALEEVNKYIGKDSKIIKLENPVVSKGRVTSITVTLDNNKVVEFKNGDSKMLDDAK